MGGLSDTWNVHLIVRWPICNIRQTIVYHNAKNKLFGCENLKIHCILYWSCYDIELLLPTGGSHLKNGGHFEFETFKNGFLKPKNLGIHLLHDSLCQFIRQLWHFAFSVFWWQPYWKWRPFWIWNLQKWIPWPEKPRNPSIAWLSKSMYNRFISFWKFYIFVAAILEMAVYQDEGPIFRLGNVNFRIQEVQIR